MSSKQKHRGQHSNDPRLFHPRWLPALNHAVYDLSWLWTRGYSEKSALAIVGDRYRLNVRQRKALLRAACRDQSRRVRQEKRLDVSALSDQSLAVDGYNLLITVESALAGGIVLLCRDGCYRDIASVHGTYRRVEETLPALKMIGQYLREQAVADVKWLLDRPVSNSGRLKGMMGELAQEHGFDWSIELVNNPDRRLVELSEAVTASSDGWVLDHCDRWVNVHAALLKEIPTAHVIDLQGEAAPLDA